MGYFHLKWCSFYRLIWPSAMPRHAQPSRTLKYKCTKNVFKRKISILADVTQNLLFIRESLLRYGTILCRKATTNVAGFPAFAL